MNPTIDPVQQFFAMFARANTQVWPLQLAWYAAAIAAVAVAIRPIGRSSQLIAGFLAVYYAWLGIVFFAINYSSISDHALAQGAMFVLGGVLFLVAGVIRQDLRFHARWDLAGVTGGAMMLYALAVYPVIGNVTGHFFPAAPLFGLAPCPSVIFTAGLLLWTRPPMPIYVLVVPLVWLMAQTPTDALAFGVVGDVARPFVGVLATGLLAWRDYRSMRARLFAGALLVVAILLLGNDELLMAFASIFLLATFTRWFLGRTAGRVPAKSMGTAGHAAP